MPTESSLTPEDRLESHFFPKLTESNLREQLPNLCKKLKDCHTLSITPNEKNVYAASSSQSQDSATGYQDAWLRDNSMVALSRWECGNHESAYKTLRALTSFLKTQENKMRAIVRNPKLAQDVQARPHVRFNAETLKELDTKWSHAQNDALGFTMWLRLRIARENSQFRLDEQEAELFYLLFTYFYAIGYWRDADSGAWEESQKVNSSSVGAVLAALIEFQESVHLKKHRTRTAENRLRECIKYGWQTLKKQLPFEAPPERKTDAALLFLCYPLRLIRKGGSTWETSMWNWILSLVRARLVGKIGTRRYIGDSYYCQDYDLWLSPEERSADFSTRISLRDELLEPGGEAQWCLFDPLISTIYGEHSARSEQIAFFNRAIAQLTPDGKCPELYYLRKGDWAPNEHTPLVWTQANLLIALEKMMITAKGL